MWQTPGSAQHLVNNIPEVKHGGARHQAVKVGRPEDGGISRIHVINP